MATINLLPWREWKREQEKQQFMILIAIVLVIVALCVLLVNRYTVGVVEAQNQRNQRLEDEITTLKEQIKEIKNLKKLREGLIARMNIVQNLQATRVLTVRLFDELINVLPDGVYLTKMQREKNKITLFGYTDSNSDISQLMRRIEVSNLVQQPELTEIKKAVEDKAPPSKDALAIKNNINEFKLSFLLKPKTGMIAK